MDVLRPVDTQGQIHLNVRGFARPADQGEIGPAAIEIDQLAGGAPFIRPGFERGHHGLALRADGQEVYCLPGDPISEDLTRLDPARDVLGLTFTYVDAFQVEAERLIQQSMTDATFDALIDATFGKAEASATKRVRETERRRRSRLHWLFADAETQAGIRDTAWAGYQAVAEYVDHYAPVRAKGDEHAARATRVLTSDDPDRLKRRAWTALAPA